MLPLLARVPAVFAAAMLPFRFDALRRLPMTYGWLSKRSVPREVMDRWFGPIVSQREIRRDLAKYVTSAKRARAELVAVEPRLAAFDRPALIVWAKQDRMMPLEHGRRLAALMPKGRLVEVEDSYTLISEDQPELLARELRAFIAEPSHAAAALQQAE
jgi:pimeloyl-ACP methyl ester carboxylesterase